MSKCVFDKITFHMIMNFIFQIGKIQLNIVYTEVNVDKTYPRNQINLKGSQLDTVCPLAIVYCYLEFKLPYLKNLKLFSIRVK